VIHTLVNVLNVFITPLELIAANVSLDSMETLEMVLLMIVSHARVRYPYHQIIFLQPVAMSPTAKQAMYVWSVQKDILEKDVKYVRTDISVTL
jgi:hypothetical protein